MADNAFYPGYMPDQSDVNPMFPGYYPGQKLPKPIKNIKPIRGFDYSTDLFLDELNELELELTNQGAYLPGWVKDRLVDDFKQQMRATVKGNVTGIDVETLDEFDANALPGAFGMNLNLNPIDWIKDPGKQASKTLTQWKNTIVNWGDVETRVRENLWKQVVEETPDYTKVVGAENFFGTAPMAEAAAGAITSRMRATAGKYGAISDLSLISHTNRTPKGLTQSFEIDPSTGNIINEKIDVSIDDAMAKVGDKVVRFERFSSFAPKRDATFDEFETAVMDAIEIDFERGAKSAGIQATISSDARLGNAYKVFKAKRQFAYDMKGISDGYSDDFGLRDGLNKMFLEGDSSSYKIDDYIKSVDKGLKNLDDQIFGGTPALAGIDPKEFAEMQKMLTPYRKHLMDMKAQAEEIKRKVGPVGATVTAQQRVTALGELRAIDALASGGFIGKGLTGGDSVIDSYQRGLLRNMSNEFTQRGAQRGLGFLVSEIENANGELRISRLKAYVDRLSYERDSDSIDTIIDLLERGNFMESIVWNRIKKYMTGATPAYYTEQVLKKLSYFGLIIKDDDRFENHAWIKGAAGIRRSFGSNMDAPGRLYGNWFKIKHDTDVTFRDQYGAVTSTQHVTFSGEVWGGKHFKGINTLYDMKTLVDKGTLTPEALSFLIRNIQPGSYDFNNQSFVAALQAANHGRKILAPKNADTFALQVVQLREWVNKNQKMLGSNSDPTKDAFWIGLIEALRKKGGPGTISIAQKYAGLLEKLAAKLNWLQNVVLAKIGKFLAPVAYIKTIVVEAVSEAIVHLLALAAGAVSGGTLGGVTEAIGRVVKVVVRFVVRRVVDIGETFVKGVLQGNFFLVFEQFEKMFLKFVKYAMIIFGIPFLFFMMISLLFFGSSMTTFSPIDPTTPSTIYGEDFVGGVDPAPGPGIPPPEAPPIATGGSVMCQGEKLGHCKISYPSYKGNTGHGTNQYWDASGPSQQSKCRYSVPYIAFPSLRWSAGGHCIGSCSPTWDTLSACYYPGATPTDWHQVDFYGFAVDYQTTCSGQYAGAMIAPNILGITSWTLTAKGCANGSVDHCAQSYYFGNIEGHGGGHVVIIHYMHMRGLPTKTTYQTGDVIQAYDPSGINHAHVEVMIDGKPQKPEDVFECN